MSLLPPGLLRNSVLAAGLVLVHPVVAQAYRTAADLKEFAETPVVRWRASAVRVFVEDQPVSPLSRAHTEAALDAAIASWLSASCELGTTIVRADAAESADIVVSWVRDWAARGWAQTAAGTTDVRYAFKDGRWSIAHADIFLQVDQPWASSPENGESRDLQAVITHELGHALGLLHNCEPRGADGAPLCLADDSFVAATMYPDYVGASQRMLGDDDEEGLCFLYGPGDSTSDPDDEEPALDPAEDAADDCTGANGCDSDGAVCTKEVQCTGSGCVSLPSESACQTRPLDFGEACEAPSQCASGLCLIEDGVGQCTRACHESCPNGYFCHEGGGVSVCVPELNTSGCAVTTGRSSSPLWLAPLFLALARLARRRCRVR